MPAAPYRLTSSRQFSAVVRHGDRAGTGLLVVHVAPSDASRFGLVVSKGVGGAVQRNRVKRRLRPLVRARLSDRAQVQAVVVRALPGAAGASSVELASALDSGLRRAWARQPDRVPAP